MTDGVFFAGDLLTSIGLGSGPLNPCAYLVLFLPTIQNIGVLMFCS